MKRIQTGRHRRKFEVLVQSRAAEAAMMALRPGDTSDDELTNEHPRAEQWLFVIAGTGNATVAKPGERARTFKLQPGTLAVIEKGERHQIRNTGRSALRTINVYVPPAYTLEGELKLIAKRKK